MSLNCTKYCGLGLFIFAVAAATVGPADARPRKRMAAAPAASAAAVGGFAAMHTLSREGGRLCFADHYHYGSSAGKPTAAAAQAAAAGSWSSFVDFEYGGTWASYAKASAKDMKCTQSTIGWSCEVSARPCR